MKKWIIKSRNSIKKQSIFDIEELHCHHPETLVNHTFSILNTPNWINIVALTEEKRIILVKQHRLGTDTFTYETPAGLIDKDEDPMCAAVRELKEETGYEAREIVLLKTLKANPAIMNTDIYFYFADGCKKTSGQELDTTEDIEVSTHSIDEICGMIKDGTIDHSIIVTALTLFFTSPYNREKKWCIF